MPRRCTICDHEQLEEINRALVGRTDSYRKIADRFGVSDRALYRHAQSHLPETLAQAQEAAEVAHSDDLLSLLKSLAERAERIIDKAEKTRDYRTALYGIRELTRNIALRAEMAGELSRQPQVNILVNPQWVEMRTLLLGALEPYPEARAAAAQALLEAGGNGRTD